MNRVIDRLEAIASPVVALGIMVAALFLMVSPIRGKLMLGFVLLAGFLLTGGWRWLMDFIRYLLAP